MNRTTWLQDRRMQKFRDVLSRWERKELSAMEAGEILGMSERQFRRYRVRYEEEGLEGLLDKRLGKASARRVPVDEIDEMLDAYRTRYLGWNVKHFHEHLVERHGFSWGYTWTKTQSHTAGLVERAKRRGARRRKRPRKPCEGMMLHQDGSHFAGLACDKRGDDASSRIVGSTRSCPVLVAHQCPLRLVLPKAFASKRVTRQPSSRVCRSTGPRGRSAPAASGRGKWRGFHPDSGAP